MRYIDIDQVRLLYVDLFCGAGGTTTGVEEARTPSGERCARVVACVNHDPHAIASHAANHPGVRHFTEDIRTLYLRPLVDALDAARHRHPQAYVVLWASLECTNFSRAKGGRPRDADSRTLAEHLFRYIEALRPDYIMIENVEEFMSWGDLDDAGRPVSRDRGRLYLRWVRGVRRYGYDFDYRMLNAADYGAYTSRRRYFGQFARRGLPIVFPTPTHSRVGERGLFHHTEPWRPVRDVLDLDDVGESIFARRKPLVEATLERIYAGLIKFVAGGKTAFLMKYNSMQQDGTYNPPSIDEPCPTVACQNRLGLACVQFLSKHFSGPAAGKNIPIDAPAGAVTCRDHHSFITAYYGAYLQNHSLREPIGTVTTHDRFSLVTPMHGAAPSAAAPSSPAMDKILAFMAAYGIADIRMRMLKVGELKRIMGFPEDYTLVGTQAEQKKYIGNAVEVGMSRALCEALWHRLATTERRRSEAV